MCYTIRHTNLLSKISTLNEATKKRNKQHAKQPRLFRFRLFLVSPSSLFFSLPCFPWWRIPLILLFRLGATPPPTLRASLNYAYSPCVLSSFFLAFLLLIYFLWLYFFFSSFSFFRFRFGHRLFHSVFFLWVLCCLLGFSFCCDSFSICSVSWYVRTLTSPFNFRLRYTICFSYCVYYLLFFICFPSEVIFRSRVIGACPVTTDCIVAMS